MRLRFLCLFVLVVTLCGIGSAQAQSRSGISAQVALWTNIKETEEPANSTVIAEYDYTAAPLMFNLGANLGNNWSVEGQALLSNLFDHDNQGRWAFDTNHIGRMYDLEGKIGWYWLDHVRLTAGIKHLFLQREQLRLSGFSFIRVDHETSLTGPSVGISGDWSDVSRFIVRGSFDFYPYLVERDSLISSTGSPRNMGFQTGGTLGYMITDHFGATVGAAINRFHTKSGDDGPDFKRTIERRTLNFGVEIRF